MLKIQTIVLRYIWLDPLDHATRNIALLWAYAEDKIVYSN